MQFSSILMCLLAAAADGAVVQHEHQHQHLSIKKDHGNNKAKTFSKNLRFKHRLRVCNAYPYAAALDVLRTPNCCAGSHKKLTPAPLEYKMCGDLSSELIAGDKLRFVVGDANAGTFTISDLPNNDAVLLLVIHRHDTLSNAVAFKSHVFANLLNAQVAVIDTFKGRAKSFAVIADGVKHENVKYNSVVALNPGEYKVTLESPKKKTEASEPLIALDRESYVIIRTGVESQSGPSYPQELIVYPASDRGLLFHAASRRTCSPPATIFVFLASCMAVLLQ
jgi:hypothetical protein